MEQLKIKKAWLDQTDEINEVVSKTIYVQPEWRGRYYLNDMGAKCVEMEGAGLFTIANFRSRKATAIYIVSDSGSNDEWNLGWGESTLENSIQKLIDALVKS